MMTEPRVRYLKVTDGGEPICDQDCSCRNIFGFYAVEECGYEENVRYRPFIGFDDHQKMTNALERKIDQLMEAIDKERLVERLHSALEGECAGLGITDKAAYAIVDYMLGHP